MVGVEVHVVDPKPQVDVVQECRGENAPSAGVVDVHDSQRCGRHQTCTIWKAAHCADLHGIPDAATQRGRKQSGGGEKEGGR